MSLELKYYEPVINRNGYVLLYPNVAENSELLKQAQPPNPYLASIYQQFPLGTRLIRGLWEFWYEKNAAVNLGIAAPLQSAAAVHAEFDDDIVVGAASAIGATTVTLTSTANLAAAPLSSKDGFAEGYLYVNDEAGEGQFYQIKGHEAASGTSNFIVTLYDALTIALTTASQVGLIQHPCANVVASKAVMTGSYLGVPLIAVTASYFFWALRYGPSPMICNAAIAKGTTVVLGTTAAQADPAVDTTTEVAIGYPLTPAVTDTETFVVMAGN